uniref:Uncharacterized protein n=1 Tax=mine drainage metagenome TaxID=410659 RepID=E6PX71_9ZZZZ
MRLLHVIRTMNPDAGGPSESVRMFAQAHQDAGAQVEVATLDVPEEEATKSAARNFPNLPVHELGPGLGVYGFSARLEPRMRENRSRFDGVIVDGVWQFHGVASGRAFGRQSALRGLQSWHAGPLFQAPFPAQAHEEAGVLDARGKPQPEPGERGLHDQRGRGADSGRGIPVLQLQACAGALRVARSRGGSGGAASRISARMAGAGREAVSAVSGADSSQEGLRPAARSLCPRGRAGDASSDGRAERGGLGHRVARQGRAVGYR